MEELLLLTKQAQQNFKVPRLIYPHASFSGSHFLNQWLNFINKMPQNWEFSLSYLALGRERCWVSFSEILAPWLQKIRNFFRPVIETIRSFTRTLSREAENSNPWAHHFPTFCSTVKSNYPISLYSLVSLKCSKASNTWSSRTLPFISIW